MSTPEKSETSDCHPHFTNNLSIISMPNLPTISQQPSGNINYEKSYSLSPGSLSFHLQEMGNVSATQASYAHFEGQNGQDPQSILHLLKTKNVDRPIIGQLNINSIAPKFEHLESLIKGNVDLLMVSETKVDDTFPTEQFKIEGYSKPVRLDRNRHGGGLMIFSRDDLLLSYLQI